MLAKCAAEQFVLYFQCNTVYGPVLFSYRDVLHCFYLTTLNLLSWLMDTVKTADGRDFFLSTEAQHMLTLLCCYWNHSS